MVGSRTARRDRRRRCSGESNRFRKSHISYSTAPAVALESALTCPWWQERRRSVTPAQRAVRQPPSPQAGQGSRRRKEIPWVILKHRLSGVQGVGDEGAKPSTHCQRRSRWSPPPASAHHTKRHRESDTTSSPVPRQLQVCDTLMSCVEL